jgi:hypothetical protein
MSDDTPTVQFPSESAPTVAFPSSTTPGSTVPPFQRPPTRQRPQRPSSGPRVLFVILAVLVVAAIVILVVILDTRLSAQSQPAATGSASATPSVAAAPSPTHTSAPPPAAPPAAAGTFTTFVVPQAQGGCGRNGSPTVMVTWATSNAKSVWIQQGSVDAAAGGGTQLPLQGDQSNVPTTFTVNCDARFNTYSITLVGDDGAHVSKTWTIRVGGRGHHF